MDRTLVGYAAGSLGLLALYPWLPAGVRSPMVMLVCVGAAACVLVGRRRVPTAWRWPWTLLATALLVFVAGNLLYRFAGPTGAAAGWLLDAVGNLLVLAGALALILRRGARDLGGLLDAGVLALAAGSVLWALLPHRLAGETSVAAQTDLFVVVFALTGVLGALLRLLTATPVRAMAWLLAAIPRANAGNITVAVGGGGATARAISGALFLATFTATGLFGLDRTAPRLVSPGADPQPERLTIARLVFLGAAVAAVPIIVGVRELPGDRATRLVLAAQGALVAALVMVRIGLLEAQRNRAVQALAHRATHDQLTGLTNRRHFIDRLRDELALGRSCVVLFCDLDGFKRVNDEHGHDAGDHLLVQVARRLRQCVPPTGVVSRFGGDEFVVLLVDTTAAAAQETRARLTQTLARPYRRVHDARIGASIGLTAANGERDPERLLRVADQRMYRDKATRGRRIR